MNINQNMINMNLMNMISGNMNNLNQKIKGREITVNVQLENKEIIEVSCFEDDTISILKEKCKIDKGFLSFDYHIFLDETSTLKKKGIYNSSIIKVVSKAQKIIFQTTFGKQFGYTFDGDCPVGMIIILFFCEIKRSDFLLDLVQKRKEFSFLFNGTKININDTTPIIDYFQRNPSPIVTFLDNFLLIGG